MGSYCPHVRVPSTAPIRQRSVVAWWRGGRVAAWGVGPAVSTPVGSVGVVVAAAVESIVFVVVAADGVLSTTGHGGAQLRQEGLAHSRSCQEKTAPVNNKETSIKSVIK